MQSQFARQRPYQDYLLALCIGAFSVAWYALLLADIRYLYTPDSAAYIEAARNLIAGKGLVTSSSLGDPTPTTPLALFPPGFPLLIAGVAIVTGLDAASAAITVSWASWALLPSALFFALSPLLRRGHVHLLSVLVVTSPGMAENGWLALSDTSFLVLIITSFGLLIRAATLREAGAAQAMMGAGLLCGFAYLLRNSGTAAFVATAFSFAFLGAFRAVALRTALKWLGWWSIGVLAAVIPLWLRNLAVFGTLQPYRMPPSDIDLLTNIRTYLQSTLIDISGVKAIGMVAWDITTLLPVTAVFAIATLAATPRLFRAWKGSTQEEKLGITLLGSYLIAGASMVILARTLYQWGEPINLRHVIQYNWALFALVSIALAAIRIRSLSAVVLLLSVTLVFTHWFHNSEKINNERNVHAAVMESTDPLQAIALQPDQGVTFTNKIKLAVSRDDDLMKLISSLPASTILVSNASDVFRIATGRPVRPLWASADCRADHVFAGIADRLPINSDFRVLVVARNETLLSGCWETLHQSLPSAHITAIERTHTLVLHGQSNSVPQATPQ